MADPTRAAPETPGPATGASADPADPVLATPDADASPSGRKCQYCASDLPADAEFCTKCELFQRRFMRSKSTIGYYTLLNAMVATVLLAMTFLIQQLPEWDMFASSDPRPVGFTCYRDKAFLTVTNRGRRLVVIEGGTVTAEGLGDNPPMRSLRIDPDTAIIDKGEARVVGMTFLHPETGGDTDFRWPPLEEDGAEGKKCEYSFKVRYQDFHDAELTDLPGAHTCPCAQSYAPTPVPAATPANAVSKEN